MSKSPKNLIKHLNTIIQQLPKELLGLWFTIEDMIYMFRKGRLSWISAEDTSKAFKHNRDSTFIHKNRMMVTFYYSFGYHYKEKPPCHNTLLMVNQHVTENYFLELESHSIADGILGSIECRSIALNDQDIEESCTYNVEEETHENKDTSHSWHKMCSIDMLNVSISCVLITHAENCKPLKLHDSPSHKILPF